MTTFVLTLLLDRELNKLNRIIDKKIEEGRPYKKEAHLHKQLVQRIKKLRRGGNVIAML